MSDDVKKYIYYPLALLIIGMVVWLGFLLVNACGFSFTCAQGALPIERTPIPTLIPATMPIPTHAVYVPKATEPPANVSHPSGNSDVARPSNSGGPGDAINLTGDAGKGAEVFAANCVPCHGETGKGGVANPGAEEKNVPTLNPAPDDLKDADPKVFAYNIDLFVQHGSTPPGASPTFQMPAWGDLGKLTQQQIADVIAYLISLNP